MRIIGKYPIPFSFLLFAKAIQGPVGLPGQVNQGPDLFFLEVSGPSARAISTHVTWCLPYELRQTWSQNSGHASFTCSYSPIASDS